MINLFKKYISQYNLINSNNKVLIAVSGGIDSVVMLDLFSNTNIEFAIAHCNFSLRGNESDEDENFVKNLAQVYNVDLFVNHCNATDYSTENSLSIQESARELRYTWFNKICSENNYSLVAIGHNQDDNIETFFINLFRGAGVKGLKSIPVKRDNIIRPLMFAPRKQIVEYAENNNLNYREDSSNSSDYYLRNKIRHKLIPEVELITSGFKTSAQKAIDNLVDADLLIQSAINEKKELLFSDINSGIISINKQSILKLSPLKIWIYYLLREFGFQRQTTDALAISLYDENQIGLKFYSSDYELLIDRNQLLVRETKTKLHNTKYTITENQKHLIEPLRIEIENLNNSSGFTFSKDRKTAYFDPIKLSFPLKIRLWQHGDRMIPYGMKGSKLISDILTDYKVNSFEKENTFVVLSGRKIIWLIGYRSSEDFKVSGSSEKILKMAIC